MKDTVKMGNALSVAKTKVIGKIKHTKIAQRIALCSAMITMAIAPGFCATEAGNLVNIIINLLFEIAKAFGIVFIIVGVFNLVKILGGNSDEQHQGQMKKTIESIIIGAVFIFAKSFLTALGIPLVVNF